MDEYGDFYRITLHPSALLPDDPRPPHSRPLVSDNGLGVNINVQPPDINPRDSHLPEKSTVVNESDDSDNGGFIFHQFGILETCSGEEEDLQTLEDSGKAEWMRNRFVAAMRIDWIGRANGIYILFDFYDLDDCAGTRYPKIQGSNWDDLGDRPGKVSCANIAVPTSSLDCIFFDLFCSRKLSIMLHAVEIVRAVHSPQGTMIRATIAE